MFEQQGHKLFRYGVGVKLTLFKLQRPSRPSGSGACPSAIESQPRKLQRDFAGGGGQEPMRVDQAAQAAAGGGAEDPMPANKAAQAAAGGGAEDPMPANQAAQVAAGDIAQDPMPVDQAAQAADSVDLVDEGSDLESHHFFHSADVPGNIGSAAVLPDALPTLDAQQDSATQLMHDLAVRLRVSSSNVGQVSACGREPCSGQQHVIQVEQHSWDQPGVDLSAVADGTSVQPRSTIKPAWDALVVAGGVVYILQHTIRTEHGVQGCALDKLLKRLGPGLKAMLLFLVPGYPKQDMAQGFRRQPYTSRKGREMSGCSRALQALDQLVASLPFS